MTDQPSDEIRAWLAAYDDFANQKILGTDSWAIFEHARIVPNDLRIIVDQLKRTRDNNDELHGENTRLRAELAGTGRRDILTDLLEHWNTHIVDEVDDNPERNPHAGFVPADKSGLVDDLMRWRGGDLNDYVSPFAIHAVTVERETDTSDATYTVRHPVDCDRLPYGELCAFDKVSDKSIVVPPQLAPGEYEANVRSTDSIAGAGEEYVEVSSTPVVRES